MNASEFFRQNKIIIIAFALSTIWFMAQHASGLSWDFSVYVLNGRYLLWDGLYYDWNVAPVVPVLLGLFQPFGPLAEYMFILLASLVWLAACLKFADSFGLDRRILYVLALNPAVLVFGLRNGTELLAASMLLLFLSEWFARKKARGALALAVATLVRYPSMIFAPLLLTADWKKFVKGILLAACLISTWLAFNWAVAGNPLASIENSFALNAMQNEYVKPIVNVPELLVFINFVIPLAAVGILTRLKSAKKMDYVMLVIFGLMIATFAFMAVKDVRYIFATTVPAMYFGAAVLRNSKKNLLWAILSASLAIAVLATIAIPHLRPELPGMYVSALADADNCMFASNAWIFMNYLGLPTEPTPWNEQIDEKIDAGYRLLMFKPDAEPEWQHNSTFTSGLPMIAETDAYVIFGHKDRCAPQIAVDSSYMKRLNEHLAAVGMPKYYPCKKLLPQALCDSFPIINRVSV